MARNTADFETQPLMQTQEAASLLGGHIGRVNIDEKQQSLLINWGGKNPKRLRPHYHPTEWTTNQAPVEVSYVHGMKDGAPLGGYRFIGVTSFKIVDREIHLEAAGATSITPRGEIPYLPGQNFLVRIDRSRIVVATGNNP